MRSGIEARAFSERLGRGGPVCFLLLDWIFDQWARTLRVDCVKECLREMQVLYSGERLIAQKFMYVAQPQWIKNTDFYRICENTSWIRALLRREII